MLGGFSKTNDVSRSVLSNIDNSGVIAPTPNIECSIIQGYFRPNATGNWLFKGYADDGMDLWVGPGGTFGDQLSNSKLSIVNDMTWVVSYPSALSAGQFYPFLLRSCNCIGQFDRHVQFKGPGFSDFTADGNGFYFHNFADLGR